MSYDTLCIIMSFCLPARYIPMTKIKFICDSNCDIPPQMALEMGIEILPFSISFEGRDYK